MQNKESKIDQLVFEKLNFEKCINDMATESYLKPSVARFKRRISTGTQDFRLQISPPLSADSRHGSLDSEEHPIERATKSGHMSRFRRWSSLGNGKVRT